VQDCFAAYVEFCTERGWTSQTRNKFANLIGDAVARTYGITVRHDIKDDDGKAQRGWNGLQLRHKDSQPSGEKRPKWSNSQFSDESDTLSPVRGNFP
jgi:hypothetical protein